VPVFGDNSIDAGFRPLVDRRKKQSHAKAQRREGSTQDKEAFNLFAFFFAPLRLCVKLLSAFGYL
jgi:hypothetical protein